MEHDIVIVLRNLSTQVLINVNLTKPDFQTPGNQVYILTFSIQDIDSCSTTID